WADLPHEQIDNVRNNLSGVVRPNDDAGRGKNAMHDWAQNHPDRVQNWKDVGDKVRDRWDGKVPGSDWWSKNHQDGKIPGSDWWSKDHPRLDPWYYHHDWHHHDWHYWWGYTPWPNLIGWFPSWGWTSPVYYDYGPGGNVIYQDNSVYVNGENVGTQEAYAESAVDLATVDPDTMQTDNP